MYHLLKLGHIKERITKRRKNCISFVQISKIEKKKFCKSWLLRFCNTRNPFSVVFKFKKFLFPKLNCRRTNCTYDNMLNHYFYFYSTPYLHPFIQHQTEHYITCKECLFDELWNQSFNVIVISLNSFLFPQFDYSHECNSQLCFR